MVYSKLDRGRQLKILPLAEREHKMTVADIYPLDAETPPYENDDLRLVADRIIQAHQKAQTGDMDDGCARHAAG